MEGIRAQYVTKKKLLQKRLLWPATGAVNGYVRSICSHWISIYKVYPNPKAFIQKSSNKIIKCFKEKTVKK